jgi:hypothetical protein
VVGAGGALAALVGANNRLEGGALVVLATAMGAPILLVAVGGVAAAIHGSDARAAWLFDALGVTPVERVAARGLAGGAFGVVAGTVYGLVAAPAATPATALAGALVAAGLAARVRR